MFDSLFQSKHSLVSSKYTSRPSILNRLILVLIALVAVYFSAPGAEYAWVSWLMPVSLWMALVGTRPAQCILLLSVYGFCMWVISTWWLLPAIIDFVDINHIIACILYVGVCVIGAIPYAIFGLCYSYFRWFDKPVGVLYVSIAFTVILSWFPSVIPSHPLYSQYKYPEVIQVLDIGGVPLLMFLMTFFQWSLVKGILSWKDNNATSYKWFSIAVLTVTLVLSYGYVRLAQYESEYQAADNTQRVNVGYVQPNFRRNDSIDDLFTRSNELLDQSNAMDLLVWPELPQYFSIINNANDRKHVLDFSKNNDVTMMVVSGYVYSTNKTNPGYYEASHLIESGHIVSSHNKTKPVPFFEYLPLEKHFPIVRTWFPGVFKYIPGNQYKPMELRKGINLIPIICFEITSQSAMRRFINAGGNIMINPVNDYWFGHSNGSSHHMALTLFKTVEYRVPWVRVANSGISAVVDATGKVVPGTQSDLFIQSMASAELYIPKERSLYAYWGDLFVYVLTLAFFYLLVRPFSLSFVKRCF